MLMGTFLLGLFCFFNNLVRFERQYPGNGMYIRRRERMVLVF